MKGDVFTKEEVRYMCGFKPAGMLRAWEALYRSKCIGGPWTISRRRLTFGALERGNQKPACGATRFEPDIIGWHIRCPLGFGTLSLWGYRRADR